MTNIRMFGRDREIISDVKFEFLLDDSESLPAGFTFEDTVEKFRFIFFGSFLAYFFFIVSFDTE